jgi:hypothetical protein
VWRDHADLRDGSFQSAEQMGVEYMSEKPEPAKLSVEECNAWVVFQAMKLSETLNDEILKITPVQRWLLRSRVINTLFNHHYRLSIDAVDEMIRKKTNDE